MRNQIGKQSRKIILQNKEQRLKLKQEKNKYLKSKQEEIINQRKNIWGFIFLLIRGIQGNCKSGNFFIFWARDFLTTWRNSKAEFFDLGPSHISTGESQNGKCPLRGHILAFAMCTSSVADWDHRLGYDSDIHMYHWFIWRDDLFEILCTFSCFQLLLKPSQICNALSTKI